MDGILESFPSERLFPGGASSFLDLGDLNEADFLSNVVRELLGSRNLRLLGTGNKTNIETQGLQDLGLVCLPFWWTAF